MFDVRNFNDVGHLWTRSAFRPWGHFPSSSAPSPSESQESWLRQTLQPSTYVVIQTAYTSASWMPGQLGTRKILHAALVRTYTWRTRTMQVYFDRHRFNVFAGVGVSQRFYELSELSHRDHTLTFLVEDVKHVTKLCKVNRNRWWQWRSVIILFVYDTFSFGVAVSASNRRSFQV